VSIDDLHATSPIEMFHDLLASTADFLTRATYVEEWLGPKRRLPVFDVPVLRDFAASERNRDRLAALLASYARLRSGTIWERSGGHWRRRRFSEMNPVDLAEVGAMARLGDLALFLSGVFPEYVATHPLEPREVARLVRVLRRGPGELVVADEPFWVLEWAGRSAYAHAGEQTLARDFRIARRVLNVLTGRHLQPRRERWFPAPG
jgi:hypothetical protein